MKYFICLIIGYLVGSVSMAAILSRAAKVDLRKNGTGNLGASNTFLVLGKGYGVIVLLFDMAKSFVIIKLSAHLFPEIGFAGMLAGCGAVAGHIFPFYMKFKGGKGLAAFCGMILAFDPADFAVMLVIAVILVLAVNYTVVMPLTLSVLFPVFVRLNSANIPSLIIALATGALVIAAHSKNIKRACDGTDIKVREYIRSELFSKTDKESIIEGNDYNE